MRKLLIFTMLLHTALVAESGTDLNEVDFTNSPEKFAGKEYSAVFVFNPMDQSVDRGRTQAARHYGGLLVSKINGDSWGSTHVYFNKADSDTIKRINSILKNQSFMEPNSFSFKVKYLGKFGDFGGGTHAFEFVSWEE